MFEINIRNDSPIEMLYTCQLPIDIAIDKLRKGIRMLNIEIVQPCQPYKSYAECEVGSVIGYIKDGRIVEIRLKGLNHYVVLKNLESTQIMPFDTICNSLVSKNTQFIELAANLILEFPNA